MKLFVKRISLFFFFPAAMLAIGFLCGILFMNYFYPGKSPKAQEQEAPSTEWQQIALDNLEQPKNQAQGADNGVGGNEGTDSIVGLSGAETEGNSVNEMSVNGGDAVVSEEAGTLADRAYNEGESPAAPVSATSEKLTADTEYVLEETDVRNHTVVETSLNLPIMYIGMDREQFLAAMELYETSPPLAELERGFISLEVLSFSAEKVVVQMNYEYTQPTKSFYIKAENGFLVVYLEDQETVYMCPNIRLDELPERVQQDIINVMFVPDEERLYDFLETYSS